MQIVPGRVMNVSGIDGMEIRRVLPWHKRRTVGPFVFLDHFGPVQMEPGQASDVPPHPHIGLATVTYHLAGIGQHRDSLGVNQIIRPGDINLMSAGRGIVHSERTPEDVRASGQSVHGLQAWIGLPREHEESEPEFQHHAAESLPEIAMGDARGRLLIGELELPGAGPESNAKIASPVRTFSPVLYMDLSLPVGGQLEVPAMPGRELGVYCLAQGGLTAGEQSIAFGELLAWDADAAVTLRANDSNADETRLMVLGGEPFPERRYLDWNFVSTSQERLKQAREDWQARRFAKVPGDDGYVPLPER